jgi:hypothetical protein
VILAIAGVYLSRSPATPIRQGARVEMVYSDTLGYHLLRNGRPFTVRGAAGANHLRELRARGANTVRVYGTDRLASVLDSAAELGLAVIADLPLPKYYPGHPHFTGYESVQSVIDSLVPIVRRYRDHPALLVWMVGNEIFEKGYSRSYLRAYNRLLSAIRAADPDHPLSTALIRRQLGEMRLYYKEPDVDFVSINMFGNLDNFLTYRKVYAPVWRGPYLISEWGQNGYWEVPTTNWGAPVEPSSYHAAREIAARYRDHLATGDKRRALGHLAFYWGNKFERTTSWFSFFSIAGRPTEKCHSLETTWRPDTPVYPGSRIDYLLVDGKGPLDNVLLTAGGKSAARIQFLSKPQPQLQTEWAIRRERWNDYDERPGVYQPVTTDWPLRSAGTAEFVVPDMPGPYRLYATVTDSTGYAATANFPFYVIAAPDA